MATLNQSDLLRRKMADRPRYASETYYGDGTARSFQVSGYPLVTGNTSLGAFQPSACVPVGSQWSATGVTWDYQNGTLTFSGTPSANSAFQVTYTYATFSDQEIDQVTASYSNYADMQLDLVDTLMADAYKRARWASQRGAFYDDTLTMTNLMMMRSALYARRTVEQGPIGGVVSWSEQQELRG